MKASSIDYKKMLLEGNYVKFDAGGNEFIEVIEREDIDRWSLNGNVGSNGGKRYPYTPYLVIEAVEELKSEGYVVVKKRSENCGCCQYSAYYYYLA